MSDQENFSIALVCERLAWLGVTFGGTAATCPAPGSDLLDLSSPGAAVRTLVVPAREDLQMLHEAQAVMSL